jgi:SSS family solute:Na+ symporter
MELNVPILIALIFYGAFMFGVSLYLMRRVKKAVDFLMGGRGLPGWVQVGTFTATGIGTGVTVGAAGLAYSSGWAGCVYPIGIGIGIMLVGLLFSEMRRYNFMTLSEEIACYYGGNKIIFEFSNFSLFLSQIFWMTVQIMGGGFVLSVVLGLPPKTCMVIAGVLIATTSLPGGLLTVVYTDVLQAIVLLIGFSILTLISLNDSGGFAGLHSKMPDAYVSFLGNEVIGYKAVISIFLALSLSIIADPCRRLIMYSGKTEKGGRNAMVIAGIIEIAFSVLVVIVGMYAFGLNPNIEAQDQALPSLVTEVLPTWLAALIVISITAAVFSSGNSNGAASGTFFMRHIYPMVMGRYPKRPLVVVRWSLVCVFIIATAMALFAGTIVDFVVDFLSVITSGLAIIILMGRYWKRSTWQGGVTALILAAGVSLSVILIPQMNEFWEKPVIPATIAGLIGHVVVSLMTKPNEVPFMDVVEMMKQQREGIDG